MKPSDVQQMMQRYKLIVEEDESNRDDLDKIIEEYESIRYRIQKSLFHFLNDTYTMRQFMSTDEYQFGVNTDWMGSKAAEDHKIGGWPLPPTYDEWVEQTLDDIRLNLTYQGGEL